MRGEVIVVEFERRCPRPKFGPGAFEIDNFRVNYYYQQGGAHQFVLSFHFLPHDRTIPPLAGSLRSLFRAVLPRLYPRGNSIRNNYLVMGPRGRQGGNCR